MAHPILKTIFLGAILLAPPVFAQPESQLHGGDTFIGGSGTHADMNAQRDVFAAGNSIALTGRAAGDMHVAGFSVDVEAPAGADLYAAGASVTLRATVAEDLTAAGFTVRSTPDAITTGNARLAGGSVVIDGPVNGALAAAGGEIILNAPIEGDARLVAEKLSFGPDARVGGTLHYSTPSEIAVPERVAAGDRVVYDELDRARAFREMRREWEWQEYPILPSFMSLAAGFVVTLGFFIVLGAIFLTFFPRHVQQLREATLARPGLAMLTGVIGLSMLFGMVPISAMTIVGIPFVPIVVLAIVVAWTLGYILGAYVVAMRVYQSFGAAEDPGLITRLVVLAVAVTVIALFNFIPFFGWVVNFTLVLLGIGAMTTAIFNWMLGNVGYARDIDLNPITEGD